MPRKALGYFERVILAIDLIVEFMEGKGREHLMPEVMLRSAVDGRL